MDMAIVAPLTAPLVYSGGQSGILALVPKAGIQGMNNDYGAKGMYRISFRYAPHNVYGDVAVFMQNADAKHSSPPPEQFHFARTRRAGHRGAPGHRRDEGLDAPVVRCPTPPGRGTRPRAGCAGRAAPRPSSRSGDRIHATNVVLVSRSTRPSGFHAQNNAPVPTYDLVGEGEALVATGGKTIAATWHKAAQDQPMTLTTADGQDVLLAPGNTWVELVPKGTGSYKVEAPAAG